MILSRIKTLSFIMTLIFVHLTKMVKNVSSCNHDGYLHDETAPVTDFPCPCNPSPRYWINRERMEFIVSTNISARSIGYKIYLTKYINFPKIYRNTTANKTHTTGIFKDVDEGAYCLIVKCLYDANEKVMLSEECIDRLDVRKVIVSYSIPGTISEIVSSTPSSPRVAATISVVSVLIASILIGVIAIIALKRHRTGRRRRYMPTDDEETFHMTQNNHTEVNENENTSLEILVVSEYGKDFSTLFASILELNPRFNVRSLEKESRSARVDLSEWIYSAVSGCDVVIVLISPTLIKNAVRYFTLKSTANFATTIDDYPSILLANLKSHVTVNMTDESKPSVLKAWVLNEDDKYPKECTWINEQFNSGVEYTLTRLKNSDIEVHEQFGKMWSVLHDTCHAETSELDRNSDVVREFLRSVKQEFG